MSAEALRERIREIPDFPKPGILFYDITTLLKDPAAYKESIDLMLEPYAGEQHRHRRRHGVARLHLQRADGLPARCRARPGPQAGQAAGRDDHRRVRARVRVEHPRDPSRRDRSPGQKVLIVDDLLATGGTVKGTIELVERLKGEVVGPGLPRRARVPQGPRPARRTARHQRHQVLTDRAARGSALADPTPPSDERRSSPSDHRPTARPTPADSADLGRRRFFRQFAGELFQGAATVVGAAQVLQRASADAAAGHPRPGDVRPDRGRPRRGDRSAARADRLPDAVPRGGRHAATSSTSGGCPTSSRSTRRSPPPRRPTPSAT